MFFIAYDKKKVSVEYIDESNGSIMGAFRSKKDAVLDALTNIDRKLQAIKGKNPPIHFTSRPVSEQVKIEQELNHFKQDLTLILNTI